MDIMDFALVVIFLVVVALVVVMSKTMVKGHPRGGAWIGPFADPFNFPAIGSKNAERRRYIDQKVRRAFPE